MTLFDNQLLVVSTFSYWKVDFIIVYYKFHKIMTLHDNYFLANLPLSNKPKMIIICINTIIFNDITL